MRVVWAESARQEWMRQYRFYYARNPDAARRTRRLVMGAVERLLEFPKIGRPGRVEGTRELVISGTPFLLIYAENPIRVELVHAYHGRQNWLDEVEG